MSAAIGTAAPDAGNGAAPDPAVAALLPAYLERRAADAVRIEQALQARDYETIAAVGHRLKGLGSTYGHDAISRAGRGLEQAARSQDEAALRQLLALYKRTLAELN